MNNNLTPSKRKTTGEQILRPITPNKTAKKQNSEEQLIKRLLADDPDRIKKEKLSSEENEYANEYDIYR